MLGGYIDVTKVKGRGSVERRVTPHSLPTHLEGSGGFGGEEDGEVGLLTARTVHLDVTLEEEERPRAFSEHKYLTIVRDDSEKELSKPLPPPVASKPTVAAKPAGRSRPPIPVHRKR